MASQRKRKYGSISGPSEDELNESIKSINNESIEQGTSTSEDDEEEFNNCNDTVVFHDLIHGHYELPKVLLKIIDTPQFQRLRFISQMGGASYVYMGACHTRFQHCLGVAYLAGKLCKVLQKRQPELEITTKDVLCVQIAGLCHDIGHGPFSKLFDNLFLPSVRPGTKWTHEKGSIDMFNHMWKENNLDSIFCDSFLNIQDIIFIKELIGASPIEDDYPPQEWPYKGRSKNKSFLYQIVSNKTTGIDVDKWDYLARDSFHLGIPNSFNYKRFIKFARVISCDGTLQICTRDKDAGTLYEMFHMRTLLQRRAISHKTSRIAKFMLSEALAKANDYILIAGTNGKMFKISDCIQDMNAYTKLTDNVLFLIQTSQDENMTEAQKLLERLHKRDLYKLIGQGILPRNIHKNENEFLDEIFDKMDNVVADKEDFIIMIEKYNYGMKDYNPVDNMRFYRKDDPDVGIQLKQDEVSLMLPKVCSERHVRLFSKKNDHFLVHNASIAFKQWYDSNITKSRKTCCDDEDSRNGN